jgi:hypothetical protein
MMYQQVKRNGIFYSLFICLMTSLHHMGTIGYTQHYRFSNYNKMIWAYCYNVTQKSMQWEKRHNAPQIIENGNVIWSKEGLCLSLKER